MNKPVYIGLTILQINKIIMLELCYDYVKTKFGEKAKLCYIDKDSFIVYMNTKYLRRHCKRC